MEVSGVGAVVALQNASFMEVSAGNVVMKNKTCLDLRGGSQFVQSGGIASTRPIDYAF